MVQQQTGLDHRKFATLQFRVQTAPRGSDRTFVFVHTAAFRSPAIECQESEEPSPLQEVLDYSRCYLKQGAPFEVGRRIEKNKK